MYDGLQTETMFTPNAEYSTPQALVVMLFTLSAKLSNGKTHDEFSHKGLREWNYQSFL